MKHFIVYVTRAEDRNIRGETQHSAMQHGKKKIELPLSLSRNMCSMFPGLRLAIPIFSQDRSPGCFCRFPSQPPSFAFVHLLLLRAHRSAPCSKRSCRQSNAKLSWDNT